MVNPDPSEAGTRLHPFPVANTAWGESWATIRDFFGGRGDLGEILDRRDWSPLPRDQGPIRIVTVREAGRIIIRWATDRRLQMLSGSQPQHDRLVGYRGDDLSDVRSGYACPQADD